RDARDRDADPARRELHGPGADGTGACRRGVRLRHAGRRAHRRRHRVDARRRARAGRGHRDVEPSLPGSELPSARRDAYRPLARVRRLGERGPRRAGRAQGQPRAHPVAPGHRHRLGREGSGALRAMTFTRHYAHWPPGAPKTLEVPRDSVYSNLAASAARNPQRTLVDYYGTRISYADIKREADALAGFLQRRCGVAKGDRVLLYLQNSAQFIIAYYAILRADAAVVPVNPMNRTEELRHYVEDAQANVAIVGQELHERIAPLGLQQVVVATYSDYVRAPTDLPLPDFVRAPRAASGGIAWRDAIALDLEPAPHTAGADDLAVLPYTSGTTGKPKGCIHTHGSVQATTMPYMYWRGDEGDSVVLSALPMFHVTGMQSGMNAPIYRGSTIVLLSRWDRDCAGMQIERARVTNWS